MPRSRHGGRHELGQNFLHHRPTIDRIMGLVAATEGSVLEIGAGDGALTSALATLERPLTAIDLDEHRVRRLRRRLPGVRVEHGDALTYPIRLDVVVSNVPFHLTTPILRRLLAASRWRDAILLTQWEVARKRAGVGGRTMMSAQSAPWFHFDLHGRVPAWAFTPRPSVDGGVLSIRRRGSPLVPSEERSSYERFVRAVFTGPGRSLDRVVAGVLGTDHRTAARLLARAGIPTEGLPRQITPTQWAALWVLRTGRLRD
ncbi:23S ribosomal RNA methyltransferase Erm [Auraticoccus sp. F435]|uniref:23S ribosomal RNA methyltransferase Erm n=1 Tax=Auraticoccus cholistanensis TaxID=2656650 RepID=A0A6A9UTG0_9ACTN|nr:23S ribosomal RNA methyltransferase Erm [Auraticoccus cholistanensis]MVA75025.1 23S ribosomal RNA methyltransferase Erm [Auraticoccus cholistanensis]